MTAPIGRGHVPVSSNTAGTFISNQPNDNSPQNSNSDNRRVGTRVMNPLGINPHLFLAAPNCLYVGSSQGNPPQNARVPVGNSLAGRGSHLSGTPNSIPAAGHGHLSGTPNVSQAAGRGAISGAPNSNPAGRGAVSGAPNYNLAAGRGNLSGGPNPQYGRFQS